MKTIKWHTWVEDGAVMIQADCGEHHSRRKVDMVRWSQIIPKKETFTMIIFGMQLDIEFLAGTEE